MSSSLVAESQVRFFSSRYRGNPFRPPDTLGTATSRFDHETAKEADYTGKPTEKVWGKAERKAMVNEERNGEEKGLIDFTVFFKLLW